VRDLTGGLGADIVVDATGRPEGLTEALRLVRPRGTVALKTTCGLPSSPLDATRIVVDEIRIQGSRCGPFAKAIEMISNKRINVASLISEVFLADQPASAVESARSRSKILIEF
jgi:threonine dehydrogenase-like Zn-dependent dehydrogenase